MKKYFLLFIMCILFLNLSAQEESVFHRKGKVLIESGYGVLGGFSSGTGISLISVKNHLFSFGANIGYFVNDNFALKLKVSILTGAISTSISSIGIGGKYYIKDKVPVELSLGTLNLANETILFYNVSAGYAIKLAQNIYLEPAINLNYNISGDDGDIGFNLVFAMIL